MAAKERHSQPNKEKSSLLVAGYIRHMEKQLNKQLIPNEINLLCFSYYFLKHKDLIVKNKKGYHTVLPSGKHTFNKIIIEENSTLTTTEWIPYQNKGGTLSLEAESIIIKTNGCINVNALGYRGGCYGGYQGESMKSQGKRTKYPNEGGGGGGDYYRGSAFYGDGGYSYGGGASWGGGGGYGTQGSDAWSDDGKGGNTYGNEKLDILHLGSGGGGGGDMSSGGGAGGGALSITTMNISIGKNASIQANGQDGKDLNYFQGGGGGGSGGSIYITAKTIKNYGSITAIGGKGNRYSGNGGVGRIRIDCNNINKLRFYKGQKVQAQEKPPAGSFYEAIIKEVGIGEVKVGYDGYEASCDEWIHSHEFSTRIKLIKPNPYVG